MLHFQIAMCLSKVVMIKHLLNLSFKMKRILILGSSPSKWAHHAPLRFWLMLTCQGQQSRRNSQHTEISQGPLTAWLYQTLRYNAPLSSRDLSQTTRTKEEPVVFKLRWAIRQNRPLTGTSVDYKPLLEAITTNGNRRCMISTIKSRDNR